MHRGRPHNFGEAILRSLSQGLALGSQSILNNLENKRRQAQQDRLFGLEEERIGIARERQTEQARQFGITQDRLSGVAELTAQHRANMLETTMLGKTSPNLFFENEKNQLELDKLEAEVDKLNAQTLDIKSGAATGRSSLFGKGSGTEITKQFFKSRLRSEIVPGGTPSFPKTEMIQPPITSATIDSVLSLLGQQGDELNNLDISRINLDNVDDAQLGALGGLSEQEQAQLLQRVAQEIGISRFNALNPQEKIEILLDLVEAK